MLSEVSLRSQIPFFIVPEVSLLPNAAPYQHAAPPMSRAPPNDIAPEPTVVPIAFEKSFAPSAIPAANDPAVSGYIVGESIMTTLSLANASRKLESMCGGLISGRWDWRSSSSINDFWCGFAGDLLVCRSAMVNYAPSIWKTFFS